MESKTVDNKVNENDEKNLNELVIKCVHLIKDWTNKEVGDFSMWMDLIKPISKIIKEQSDNTQIENIELTINIIQKIGLKYYDEHKNDISGEAQKVLDIVLSDTGKFILQSSTSLIGKLLREIDTNNDGEISQEECGAFVKKIFPCCFPLK
tara:strand:+ start:77 stop:529 length:453 start_codon:yes stop_codon:yes gene_type:complete